MGTATFARASIQDALLLLRSQIASVTGLDESFVVVTLDDQAPHYRGNRDVLLVLGDESKDEPMIEGGGRVVNMRYRTVDVVPRLRCHLDRSDADLLKLTDESLGFLAFEALVVDAVELFIATDASENALSLPMTADRVSRPQRDRDDPNWVSSRFSVTIAYLRDLDQSRQ